MDRHLRLSNRFFLLGLGLAGLIVYTLLLGAIAFIRGQVMNAWIFPMAIVMTGITQYFAARAMFPEKPLQVFFQGLLPLLLLAAASIWISGKIYDVSFDGQWYQQEVVHKLKTGWNPYLRVLEAPDAVLSPEEPSAQCPAPATGADSLAAANLKYNLFNHAPKSIAIVEAAIYSLTGRIETGKAVNGLALLTALSLCLAWLYRQEKISVAKKWALALLAACQPLTISQLSTFCVDGSLAALFLSLFACLLLISESTGHYRLFLFGLLLIVCLNISVSAIPWLMACCAGFIFYFRRNQDPVRAKKLLYATLLATLVGLLFIGFHPYFTNLITEASPFYGWLDNGRLLLKTTPSYLAGRIRPEPVPGLLLFPFWLLLVAVIFWLDWRATNLSRWFRLVLYILATTRIVLALSGLVSTVLASAKVAYQLDQLRSAGESVTVELCAYRSFDSNLVRLDENRIPYSEGTVSGQHIAYLFGSASRVSTAEPLPALPKPLLVRMAEDLTGEP